MYLAGLLSTTWDKSPVDNILELVSTCREPCIEPHSTTPYWAPFYEPSIEPHSKQRRDNYLAGLLLTTWEEVQVDNILELVSVCMEPHSTIPYWTPFYNLILNPILKPHMKTLSTTSYWIPLYNPILNLILKPHMEPLYNPILNPILQPYSTTSY